MLDATEKLGGEALWARWYGLRTKSHCKIPLKDSIVNSTSLGCPTSELSLPCWVLLNGAYTFLQLKSERVGGEALWSRWYGWRIKFHYKIPL
jgi:hypothetical protein